LQGSFCLSIFRDGAANVRSVSIGADIYDVVLILRNRKAVNAFANPKVSIGAELTVAAGPLGAGAMVGIVS
jgi:lipid-binding SYLF domain-containing protein